MKLRALSFLYLWGVGCASCEWRAFEEGMERLRACAARKDCCGSETDWITIIEPAVSCRRVVCRQLVLGEGSKASRDHPFPRGGEGYADIMQAIARGRSAAWVHCFSYAKEDGREYLNMDFYFRIGGVITFKNAKKLKEAVQYIPLEKILLETDSPYLAPEPSGGPFLAESAFVAEAIATRILRGVVEITERNARKLFRVMGVWGHRKAVMG